MTEQIKVSEVSSILRQQLEGIHTSIKLEEVGDRIAGERRRGPHLRAG